MQLQGLCRTLKHLRRKLLIFHFFFANLSRLKTDAHYRTNVDKKFIRNSPVAVLSCQFLVIFGAINT